MAKRLAIAGLNVAYGRKNYPTGGPFPVDLKAGLYNVPYSPPPHGFKAHWKLFKKGRKKGKKKRRKKGEKQTKKRQKDKK